MNYGCLTSGMYYTQALAEYAIEQNKDSEVVNALGEQECYSNTSFNPQYGAITYNYSYNFEGENVSEVGIVGRANQMLGFLSSFMPGAQGGDVYQLSKRELGGYDIANNILIYPINSEDKIHVIEYLDAWNGMGDIVVGGKTIKADEREKITYTDTLSLIISMINSMVKIVTIALVGFTSLSLFVSCVMIAIMTYVSVMERVKEIGVIRSLGGRKIDVANLFNAENLMIGFSSGFIGVLITYLLVLIINIIVKHMVGFAIAIFPIYYALIMIALSVALTMLAGIIPAFKASKQDPVVALRTE